MAEKFVIGPFNTGLQKNVRPFLAMEDAFVRLENAYVWRSELRKRPGSSVMNEEVDDDQQQLYSRLRIKINTTDGTGAASGTVPGSIFKVGQLFSIDDNYYMVTADGAPATVKTNGLGTLTYNTTGGSAGQYTFAGAELNTDIYFYPAEPVQTFAIYEQTDLNDELTVAFDTQFVYQFGFATGWISLGPVPPAAGSGVWTDTAGQKANFHSTFNWRGTQSYDYNLFVVNGLINDEVQYFDGTNWTKFKPKFGSGANDDILTAKVVIGFKDRLLLMNTIEVTGSEDPYRNRVRFSQNGSPFNADNAWRQDIVGKGSYIEAPTKEAIVGAKIIRDRCIVFFERSIYELVYTSNEVLPFVFQELDSNLGVESINSLISFDRQVLGFGANGIHACNGINVQRIDDKIPDEIFSVHNENAGPQRVNGIRDYKNGMVYWSYPSTERTDTDSGTYPNKILALNYKDGSWSNFDDSITAFGYYQLEQDEIIGNIGETWEEANFPWIDITKQAKFRTVIGGNQQGWTFLFDPDVSDQADTWSITDVSVAGNVVTITSIDHNLKIDDYIYIFKASGITGLDDNSYRINDVTGSNTFTIVQDGVTGSFTGWGEFTFQPRLDVWTKEFNFFTKLSVNTHFKEINFNLKKTGDEDEPGGAITVDYATSFNTEVVRQNENDALLGSKTISTEANPLAPREETQLQIWRNSYPIIEGETIQIRFGFTDEQMLDADLQSNDFKLYMMIIHANPTYPI